MINSICSKRPYPLHDIISETRENSKLRDEDIYIAKEYGITIYHAILRNEKVVVVVENDDAEYVNITETLKQRYR